MFNKIDNYLRTITARNNLVMLIVNPVAFLLVLILYGYNWRIFAKVPVIFLIPVLLFLLVFAGTLTVYCCIELLKRYKSRK
jgi:hypothetical protein